MGIAQYKNAAKQLRTKGINTTHQTISSLASFDASRFVRQMMQLLINFWDFWFFTSSSFKLWIILKRMIIKQSFHCEALKAKHYSLGFRLYWKSSMKISVKTQIWRNSLKCWKTKENFLSVEPISRSLRSILWKLVS